MKKKGFTLIELLAVIVILAVIALIAVPIILNLIEQSRRKAAVSSALGYVRSVNYKIANEALFDRVVNEDEDYIIGENALDISANNVDDITGAYTIINGRVDWAGLCVWKKYSVEYNNGFAEITGNHCGIDNYEFEEPEGIDLHIACETDADSVYSNNTGFKIRKVEDLVCLSNLANTGINFSGKNIYLLNDIDLADSSTSNYIDSNTTIYGDINGNGTTDGLLTEVTTGAGFKPIGNNNNQFKGNFEGYAHTISNLMINRNTAYLGLFGYNAGTIKGVKFRDASITSAYNNTTYAGIIAGYSTGTIKNVDVKGSVEISSTYAGGIVGYSTGVLDDALFSGTVKGNNYVGGLIGASSGTSSNPATARGVVYDSTTTVTKGSYPYVGKTLGFIGNTTYKAFNTNTTTFTGRIEGGRDGEPIPAITLEGIDEALDTYIGGDNDSDNYYFDYDSDGKVTLYCALDKNSRIRTDKLKGNGTEQSPYLIKTADDWRLASATVSQGKYYSIEKNIDFTNKNFYTLGTNENKFNGNINGNMKTISNISLKGYNHVGIIGYNEGTIEGLNLNNVTVTTTGRNLGAVAGYNTGTIKGINATNVNVSSTYNGNTETSSGYNDTYAGGIAGYNTGTVKDVSAEGNISVTQITAGGIVGYSNNVVESALFKGTVGGNDWTGGLVGYSSGASSSNLATVKGAVYDTTINNVKTSFPRTGKATGYIGNTTFKGFNANSTAFTGRRESGRDGEPLPMITIEGVDGVLDTYVGGDNDSNGYYFDYDSTGKLIVYSTAEDKNPIKNTLAGDGTASNPYMISSIADWKIASAFSNQNKYFELTSDLDFTNQKFYPLGTETNKFSGNINGNMHKLSNIELYGYDYLGLVGYNTGLIEGFVIDNISVNATNANVGGIVGYNTGTVNGIKIRNSLVKSTNNGYTELCAGCDENYVGGIVGYNDAGLIKNVDFRGDIKGNGRFVGGIVGRSPYGNVDEAVFKGNVEGVNFVGGLAGYIYGKSGSKATLKGFVYDSTVKLTMTSSSGNSVGASLGAGDTLNHTVRNYNVQLTYPASNRYNGSDGVGIASLEDSTISPALDLTDSNSDGYYFKICNGNIELFSTRNNPIGTDACTSSGPVDTTDYEENVTNPTHGGIVYLDPQNPTRVCTKADVDANKNNNGGLNGVKTGCMRFYIIDEEILTYKLLLDHNTSGNIAYANESDYLEAGGDMTEWNTNEGSTSMGPVTANKRLASDTAGWIGNPRLITTNELAKITGIDGDLLWDSSKTYANPVTDTATQIGGYYLDGSGNTYAGWQTQVADASNKSKYSWIYNNTSNCLQTGCRIEDNNTYPTGNNSSSAIFGFWTSDARSITEPWVVTSAGLVATNNVTNDSNVGVRPVITVTKTTVTVH